MKNAVHPLPLRCRTPSNPPINLYMSARQSLEWLIRGRIRMCLSLFSLPFLFSPSGSSIWPCLPTTASSVCSGGSCVSGSDCRPTLVFAVWLGLWVDWFLFCWVNGGGWIGLIGRGDGGSRHSWGFFWCFDLTEEEGTAGITRGLW